MKYPNWGTPCFQPPLSFFPKNLYTLTSEPNLSHWGNELGSSHLKRRKVSTPLLSIEKKNKDIIKTTHKKAHSNINCQPLKILFATLPYHYTEATDYPVCARHERCSGLQQEFQNCK